MNFWLFVVLSLNFWLIPLIPDVFEDGQITEWLMGITLLLAVGFQGLAKPGFRVWAASTCLVIIAAVGVEELFPDTQYVENTVFAISFGAATALYFHTMANSLDVVTFDTILAAACTYILIGMLFAAVFGLLVEFDPAAFSIGGTRPDYEDMLYFSFATLTTLGAVGIAPVSELAQMLTVFEAMVGLIYVAILVGAVVGAYAARMVRN